MKLKWSIQALEAFSSIQSQHFSLLETIEYKICLVKRIEEKILLLGKSIPAGNPGWEGSYKVIIDKYIVYYSFSIDRETCNIEYFMHSRQNR